LDSELEKCSCLIFR